MLVDEQASGGFQLGLVSPHSSSVFPDNASTSTRTVAFIDANLANVTEVMAGVQADLKVLLDPTRDGIAQITETLQQFSNLASVNIISHGASGQVHLGSGVLSTASLGHYATDVERWKAALSADADILFYGCNVAEGKMGQGFVQELSSLTGADIAASTDLTGAGGDWLLEYATGTIETPSPLSENFVEGYQGQLATLLTTQTPSQPNKTDGTGSAGDYELGMQFVSAKAGTINAIRYYKSPSETGTHVGRIWSSTGTQLAQVTFTNETGSGWQQQALSTSLSIAAGTTYIVSVNVNTHYAISQNGFNSAITNGDLRGSNGVFNLSPSLFPTQSWNSSNYFRDVDFTPSATNPTNTVGTASITGTLRQNQTLAASVADANGLNGVTINYQWQQLSGGTWSNIAGATAQTLTLQQAQVGNQVRVNATYTDSDGNNENILSPATTAIANVNDAGVVAIAGTPAQNQTLTANVTDVDGLTGVTVAYQWQSSTNGTTWSNISGATARTFTLQSAQVGRQVRVRATYTDALGSSENRLSAATTAVTSSSNSPGTVAITGTTTEDQTLTATVSDADGLTGVTINYQWQQLNGSTWGNIAGATGRTLTLNDPQVSRQVRVNARYTDSLGSSENILSSATAAIANVDDAGVVAISGTPTQNQTLTANVSDVDGLTGVTINYQWQQLNGSTWSNITGATGKTFTLGGSLVGQQVRVNATYTDVLGGSENIFSPATSQISAPSALTSLFPATATPSQPNFTDGPGVDWEYGMRFTSSQSGQIQAIRYYKAPIETGTHIGRIWSSTGELLASVTFTNETASGWQQQALTEPVGVAAGTTYVVSVNANNHYATTLNGFDNSVTSGSLTAPVGAGVYNETVGSFPSLVYSNENYFRDVVFSAVSTVSLRDSSTIFVNEAEGTATVTVVRTGSTQEQLTVEYTTNELGTAGAATAGADYTQPTFNGRANTGQVVFEVGESQKSFTIPILNDGLFEVNETFAIGLQNPSSGSLGTPRTVLITILDDDSPSTISISEPTLTVSEAAATATITVQRSGNTTQAASVNFSTGNGTAIAGSDYTATTGTINFAAGQTTQTVAIPVLNDTLTESNETFTSTLSNASGAILGSPITSTITILDNDLTLGTLNRQTVTVGLTQPTALDWTPDGRYMLVAQKNGIVRVVDNGTLRSTPLIDLSSQVNSNDNNDRGLLGIAINPNLATNPYIYLLYTYDPPETDGRTGLAGPDGNGNRPSRLVRVTVNLTTMIADPTSLVVLVGTNSTWAYTSRPDVNSNGNSSILPSGIVNGTTITAPADQIDVGIQDNDPDRAGIQNQNIRDYLASDGDSHSIGAVQFGPDGWLYLTNGDGTSYNFVDPRGVRVQDINNLSGKVLRINPITGEGVPGNPFYETDDPNSNQSKVFYSGLRNGFRFTFDPVTNLPVVGDVGWTTWEEVNTGAPGSNFGWPYLEGPNRTGGYQGLAQAISFYNNGNRNNPSDQAAVFPILSRRHGAPDNANAIMVGDFYNSNTLMFGDVNGGTLYAATLNASRQVTEVQVFDSNLPYVVDMEMGPDGRLYGLDLVTGSILRWNPA